MRHHRYSEAALKECLASAVIGKLLEEFIHTKPVEWEGKQSVGQLEFNVRI